MLHRGPPSSSGACALAGAKRWLTTPRNDYGPFAVVARAVEKRGDDSDGQGSMLSTDQQHTLKRVFKTALYGHTPPYTQHRYKSISRRVLGNRPRTAWLAPHLRHPEDRLKGKGRALSTAAAFELLDAEPIEGLENRYHDFGGDGVVHVEHPRPGDIVEARRCVYTAFCLFGWAR
jgi:hypothetical protein